MTENKYTYCVPQPNQKGIHIHIPKTGGTCRKNYLKKRAPHMILSHTSANFLRIKLNASFDGFYDKMFTFSMVRNPWDRTVSLYFFFLRHGLQNMSFEDFVYHKAPVLNEYSIDLAVVDTFSQKAWLTDHKTGEIIVDFIGRMENFDEDFDRIREQVGLKPLGKYKVINKQTEGHYSKYYDENTIEVVRQRCNWEIEKFGYEFESSIKEAV